MKIGDLVYDPSLCKYGIIFARVESVVPWRVFYEDGEVDLACDHDLIQKGSSALRGKE